MDRVAEEKMDAVFSRILNEYDAPFPLRNNT